MMKKILFMLFTSILVFYGCGDKKLVDGVSISGTIKNPIDGGSVTLEKLDFQATTVVDSFTTTSNTFSFEVSAAEQSFYRINIYGKQYVPFILGLNDKDIKISADGDKASGKFEVTGSLATDQKDEADSVMQRYSKQMQGLQKEAVVARNSQDEQMWLSVMERSRIAESRKNKELKRIIWDNAPSVSAVYALNYIDFESQFAFVDSVANKFNEELPDSEYSISLMERVTKFKKLAVGSEAPEITLADANGNNISLSSLRGQYVLIDFWASWCKPCRLENPNVKKVYAQYADKGFEILGVSLDRNSEKWKQAIQVDGLPWKHVLDIQSEEGASYTYEVQTIPATFLVDPEGKIVAKGLRGPSLEAKLKEIFG